VGEVNPHECTDHDHDAEAPHPRAPGLLWVAVLGVWLVATVAALGAMAHYASRPGLAANAPTTWPEASRLPRPRGTATLVMLAHTRCACTRASIHELDRLMTHAGDHTTAFVVFVGPHDEPGERGVLDVREAARAIPNVNVIEDESEARLFGGATSGQVLLYDEAGALVFQGGITPSRGHEGASVGSDTLRSFLTTRDLPAVAASSPPASDVFGCALFDARKR
jgi:hypothetical protein